MLVFKSRFLLCISFSRGEHIFIYKKVKIIVDYLKYYA